MASDMIGKLAVNLTMNTAAFQKGATIAEKRAQAMQTKMQGIGKSITGVGSAVAAAGIAMAGSALLDNFKNIAKTGLDYVSSLGETAQQLGVTTGALQQYRFIASQVGIEQDVMDKGLVKLTGKLGDLAVGAKGADKPFSRLNLSTTELAAVSKMTAEQALPFLADKFKALGSETERVAAAQELFGEKMGGKFMTLLSGGSVGITAMTDAYKKLGIAMTDAQITAADNAADKIGALNQVISAEQAKVAIANAEGLIAYEKAVANLKTTLAVGTGEFVSFFADLPEMAQLYSDTLSSSETYAAKYGKDAFYMENHATLWEKLGVKMDAWAVSFDGAVGRAKKNISDFGASMSAMASNAVKYVLNMVGSISNWIGNKLAAVWEGAKAKIRSVVDMFDWMDNEVVRNSFVPDMVDGIGFWMSKLDQKMVDPANMATKSVAKSMQDLEKDIKPIMERLFSEEKKFNDYKLEKSKISDYFTKTGKSADELALVLRRLFQEYNNIGDVEIMNDIDMSLPLENIELSYKALGIAANDNFNKIDSINVSVQESFKDMANNTLNSLSSLIDGIKGGGIVGILQGLVGVFTQLSSTGLLGKKLQSIVSSPIDGARANGGPISSGKRYLVGENGPELFSSNRSGYITSNDNMQQGGRAQTIKIVPSAYFDAIVDQRAMNVAAPMAMRGGLAGASLAEQRMASMKRNRIP